MAAKAKKSDKEDDAAAPPAEGEGGGAPAKKKLPLKLIIIGVVGLLVVGGGGYGAYAMLFSHKGEHHEAAPVVKPAVFVDVPEVLVNFSNPGSDRTQYLKIKMTFEVPDQALMQQIQPLMPRVVDTFQTYLRELRPMDLEGSAGLFRLKEELTRRVNAVVAPNHVNAVLFKEIVIQ